MKKWEYKILTSADLDRFRKSENIPCNPVQDQGLGRLLTKLGKDGWRIIPVLPPVSACLFIMEREVPEPPTDEKFECLTPADADRVRGYEPGNLS